MNNFFLFIALTSIALFTACSQQEVEVIATIPTTEILEIGKSEFTIDNEKSQVFEEIALLLTNSSLNADAYHWDFGNGDTSTEANPTYKYNRHGFFTIKLTITDEYGNIDETSHDIEVICMFANQDHDIN